MEIKYYPENIFASYESITKELVIIEFEDGDRHIEIEVNRHDFVNMAKQIK